MGLTRFLNGWCNIERYYIKLFYYKHNSNLVKVLFVKLLELFLFRVVRNKFYSLFREDVGNVHTFLKSRDAYDDIFRCRNLDFKQLPENGLQLTPHLPTPTPPPENYKVFLHKLKKTKVNFKTSLIHFYALRLLYFKFSVDPIFKSSRIK